MGLTRVLKQRRTVALGLMLAALASHPALAQEVTGSLQGTVVSATGAPEPQVVIALTGHNLQGSRMTDTDRRGFYQFLAVPPGTYTLHLARVGLQPIDVDGVIVELGHATAVPALKTAAQPITMEAVVVQAPRITLDPAHTGSGGTLRSREYASLPVDRDYKSLITILPQANQSYRGDPVNVAGSTGLENQYYIDGVNVTDSNTADRATSLPYNFVRAVEVKIGGYEAQYGRALGAVVNAVTYSGTNEFEASVFGFTQPGGLAMDARMAPGVSARKPTSYDYGIRLGGPLVRDRLWYSAAVNPRTDQVDNEIVGFGSFTDRTKAVRFAGKVTWKASSSTNLELSVFGDPTTRDQVLPLRGGLTSATTPDALLARVESGGTTASLRAGVTVSRSLLLQASAARQWDRYKFAGATPTGRGESYWDFVNGTMEGGVREHQDDDRGRTSLTARGTYILPGHTVVAGVDYEDVETRSSAQFGPTVFRNGESLYLRELEGYDGISHNRSPTAYLQDSWRITDRLAVNPGLRWSGQYITGANGHSAQRITDEWQPRAGFSWQLGPAGAQRLFGSYGRFYQTLPTFLPLTTYVDYLMTLSYYHTDPRQPGAVADSVFDYTTPESAIENLKHTPDLEAENFDEFTLGYERLLGAQAKLTVRAMRRNLRSAFVQGVNLPSIVMGTPGKGDFDWLPPVKREYTALEISAEGAWSRLEYRTSYVLSRTWGNYPGLFGSDLGIDQPGINFSYNFPNQARNSSGLLPNDHTHVVKVSGSYTTRLGLVVGAVLTFESGTPINAFVPGGPFAANSPSFAVARGSAGRTPALWDLGLRTAYDLPIVRGPRVQVLLDLLHVGNPRRAVKVDEYTFTSLDENGNPATPNSNYKHATAYQPPMAVRLGMQASF
jgi:hypothetical protein